MNIYRNITLAYFASGISIAILVIFGLLYMEKSQDQVRYIDAVEHTYQVLSSINYCEKMLMEAEATHRGYLLTGEDNFKELFKNTLPEIDSSLKKIGEFTNDNYGQKTYFFQLRRFVATRVMILEKNLLLKTNNPQFVENMRLGVFAMDNCRRYMAKMRASEETLLGIRLETKNKYQRLNLSFFKITFITACLICIIAIGIFFRELGIRLKTQQNLNSKIKELSNSKKELEEITFAASHDLQEPMRKVRILSTMITRKFTNKIPENDLEALFRINKITEQMQSLLTDLVVYTNLLDPNEKYSDVNLYDLFKEVYHKVFKSENARLQILSHLPVIHGSRAQLERMLLSILDNASKFKHPGRELSITVNYELKPVAETELKLDPLLSERYHQITIRDNGIGFDKAYNDKIFGLFQRLHTQAEYPGKGTGLSIVRRVMTNHKGYVLSDGEQRVGASFTLYFPV